MSLSDCENCWETPCVCGHEYKNISISRAKELIWAIIKNKTQLERNKILKDYFKK